MPQEEDYEVQRRKTQEHHTKGAERQKSGAEGGSNGANEGKEGGGGGGVKPSVARLGLRRLTLGSKRQMSSMSSTAIRAVSAAGGANGLSEGLSEILLDASRALVQVTYLVNR